MMKRDKDNPNDLEKREQWRDNTGNEMNIVVDNGSQLYPIEIKAGKTVTSEYPLNFRFHVLKNQ